MGRFINADGYASTGQGLLGYNMFAYCHNKPVLFRDPSGCEIETYDWEDPNNLAALNLALDYLRGTEEAGWLIEWAESEDTEAVQIVFCQNSAIYNNHEMKMIYWDPNRGLELLDGSIMSPAIALAHELYHFKGQKGQKETDKRDKRGRTFEGQKGRTKGDVPSVFTSCGTTTQLLLCSGRSPEQSGVWGLCSL